MKHPNWQLENQALAIIDMQNAFCDERGSFFKRGHHIANIPTIKSSILDLVRLFKSRNLPIVCTKMEFSADYREAGLLVTEKYPVIRETQAYLQGSWDSELVDELKLALGSNALIFSKTRYDPFVMPAFEQAMRSLSVQGFILAGVLTNVCVEAFARSAFDRDFQITLVPEATGTYCQELYKSSVSNIQAHFGEVVPLENILKGTFINPPNFLKRRKFTTPKIDTDIRRNPPHAKQPA